MSELSVRTLGDDDWPVYRQLRLTALQQDPESFVSTYQDEQGYDEQFWRQRMARSTRFVARDDLMDQPVGIVSVGASEDSDRGDLFGLWVDPAHRGSGVARLLVQAAARQARADGRRGLSLWVSTENGSAVAFFSSAGFRPTESRRPQAGPLGGSEIAMELSVREDPSAVPTTSL